MFLALPVPIGVLQQIKNIQRNFLWGKGEEKKEMGSGSVGQAPQT